ncbi:MAG TPA: hypothetical protein VFU11_05410 [Solirubrobacterales bacterium]|nr:hypothetical protein [Solirubrobacterales bacterium]
MSEHLAVGTKRRYVILIAIVATLAATYSLAVWTPSASADESCNSGHACVWSFWHFQEAKGESLCTGGAHPLNGLKRSIKNRCANKAVWIRDNGVANGCVNPGVNFTTVEFHEIWVGAEGSRCSG